MSEILNPRRVEAIFMDCLFRDGEDTTRHVKAEGITQNFGFHPDRIASHAKEIETMLGELPESFMQSKGGGMSFLNACMDKHGDQWGEHRNMEQLFALGIGIGKVKCCLGRQFWNVLPGGVPYYAVVDTVTTEPVTA